MVGLTLLLGSLAVLRGRRHSLQRQPSGGQVGSVNVLFLAGQRCSALPLGYMPVPDPDQPVVSGSCRAGQ